MKMLRRIKLLFKRFTKREADKTARIEEIEKELKGIHAEQKQYRALLVTQPEEGIFGINHE